MQGNNESISRKRNNTSSRLTQSRNSNNVSENPNGNVCDFIAEARRMSDDDALKFVIYTINKYEYYCGLYRVSPIDYTKPTDARLLGPKAPWKKFMLREFAYHANNKTNPPFRNFIGSLASLRGITRSFDTSYVSTLTVAVLAPNLKGIGCNASQAENYAKMLIDSARLIDSKRCRRNVISRINSVMPIMNPSNVVRGFRHLVGTGFGNALTFDLLKELDCKTFDFPKPDMHIRRTMVCLLDTVLIRAYADPNLLRKLNEFDAVEVFKIILKKATNAYHRHGGTLDNLYCYPLDRMIYILNAGNKSKFFLHTITGPASRYKLFIDKLPSYHGITIGRHEINLVDTYFDI